jgi:hypothetical protein
MSSGEGEGGAEGKVEVEGGRKKFGGRCFVQGQKINNL